MLDAKEDTTTHQGAILTLIHMWYTNIEHDGRKYKINTFVNTRTLNLSSYQDRDYVSVCLSVIETKSLFKSRKEYHENKY